MVGGGGSAGGCVCACKVAKTLIHLDAPVNQMEPRGRRLCSLQIKKLGGMQGIIYTLFVWVFFVFFFFMYVHSRTKCTSNGSGVQTGSDTSGGPST